MSIALESCDNPCMPRRYIKKRKTTAKDPPISRRAVAGHRTIRKKALEKPENNLPLAGDRKPRDTSTGPADARKITLRHQRELGLTRIEARRQKRRRIEHLEPPPEPQIKAESFAPSKRTLSTEARELLAKVDEGGIPLMMTQNLKRIASEHGITVRGDMTPDDVVRLLREFASSIPKPRKHPDIFANIIWPDKSNSSPDE